MDLPLALTVSDHTIFVIAALVVIVVCVLWILGWIRRRNP